MQKVPQGPNWTENADKADEAEIVQLAYFLRFANGMRRYRKNWRREGDSYCRYASKTNKLLILKHSQNAENGGNAAIWYVTGTGRLPAPHPMP